MFFLELLMATKDSDAVTVKWLMGLIITGLTAAVGALALYVRHLVGLRIDEAAKDGASDTKLKNDYENRIKDIERSHEKQLSDLKATHEKSLLEIRTDAEIRVRDSIEDCASRLEAFQASFNKALQEQTEQYESRFQTSINAVVVRKDEQVAILNKRIISLEEKLDSERSERRSLEKDFREGSLQILREMMEVVQKNELALAANTDASKETKVILESVKAALQNYHD